MINFFKASCFMCVVGLLLLNPPISLLAIIGFFCLLITNIIKEKYWLSSIILLVESALIVSIAQKHTEFTLFFILVTFDAMRIAHYYLAILVVGLAVPLLDFANLVVFLFLVIISGTFGIYVHRYSMRIMKLTTEYDRERQLRFRLEKTKASLIASQEEQAHLTEVTERNRIARQIHDNLGHSLSGLFMQLQAAEKMLAIDDTKAKQLLTNSITGLSNSIDLLRNTVHNLKPIEKLGMDYIQKIIDEFQYCPVSFKTFGDWQRLSPSYLELLATTIKEGLTNASRYSKATRIEIEIEVTEAYARLYIKDNGVGCPNVQEGLGLSGIKERVRAVNGHVSITPNDGFMIVCFIPLCEGGGVIASTSS